MSIITDYQDLLAASLGDKAEQVARIRADKRNRTPVGQIKAEKTADGNAELLIYDVIGFDFWTGGGVTPKGLIDQIESLKPFDILTVRVNSPGGSVFDGIAIYNILLNQDAPVAVEIDGWAASAASFIVQAADAGKLKISEAGMMMVHRAWDIAMGNTNDFRSMADVLEKIDGQIATIYAGRSKVKASAWLKAMDAETWYTGKEAVAAKLADSTVPAKRAAAMFNAADFGCKAPPVAAVEPEEEGEEEATPRPPEEAKPNHEADVAIRLRLLGTAQ